MDGEVLTTRVIALSGDRVIVHNGVLSVNGETVANGNFLHNMDFIVEDGYCFIMGDNMENVFYGNIRKDTIQAKVWF
jgi:signal peptidase I